MNDLKKELKDKLKEAQLEEKELAEKRTWHDQQIYEINKRITQLVIYINNLEGVIKNGNF